MFTNRRRNSSGVAHFGEQGPPHLLSRACTGWTLGQSWRWPRTLPCKVPTPLPAPPLPVHCATPTALASAPRVLTSPAVGWGSRSHARRLELGRPKGGTVPVPRPLVHLASQLLPALPEGRACVGSLPVPLGWPRGGHAAGALGASVPCGSLDGAPTLGTGLPQCPLVPPSAPRHFVLCFPRGLVRPVLLLSPPVRARRPVAHAGAPGASITHREVFGHVFPRSPAP